MKVQNFFPVLDSKIFTDFDNEYIWTIIPGLIAKVPVRAANQNL